MDISGDQIELVSQVLRNKAIHEVFSVKNGLLLGLTGLYIWSLDRVAKSGITLDDKSALDLALLIAFFYRIKALGQTAHKWYFKQRRDLKTLKNKEESIVFAVSNANNDES